MPSPPTTIKRDSHDIPPAPEWGDDPISFYQATDAWLAELHLRCEDAEWVRRYREAMADAPPVETPLDPHPNPGDAAGWRGWWKHYNQTFAAAGASAEGLDDPPPPVRRREKNTSRVPLLEDTRAVRRLVEPLVRREAIRFLAEHLPEAVNALVQQALRQEGRGEP